MGRQRLGVNLVSLIVTLREEGLLPIRTIQWYLRTFHQLKLSVGAIVRAVQQVARQGGPEVGEALERIRASPVVHADESGWRENGKNGYVWTFSTPTEQYFLRRGQGGEVVNEVLGESFEGILVSDFYVAYHHYPGLKQRCWAHLLRDFHKLKALYPEDAGLARWARRVQRLYAKAVDWAAAGGHSPGGRWRWKSGCSGCAGLSWKTPWRSRENCAGGLSGTSRNCSSLFPTRRLPQTTTLRNGVCAIW